MSHGSEVEECFGGLNVGRRRDVELGRLGIGAGGLTKLKRGVASSDVFRRQEHRPAPAPLSLALIVLRLRSHGALRLLPRPDDARTV